MEKNKILEFDYQIRRSSRARKTRIVVSGGKVEVVAPYEIPEPKLHEFVWSQQDWIRKTVKKMQSQARKIRTLAPPVYQEGVDIPFLGRKYRLSVTEGELQSRTRVKFDFNSGFIVSLPGFEQDYSSELIRVAIIHWMMNQALIDAKKYVDKHSAKFQLHPRSIRIKNLKSRWGSCGIHDDINLNWLLIIAPSEVMEYVVVHELSHIRHRNHSQAFWQLVEQHIADYRQHRQWLKQNGQQLMAGL